MKRLITILTILASMLAVSCNKAETPAHEEAMTYSVSIPTTKAVNADGSAINKVWYALYKTDGTLVTNYQPVDFTGGSANCQVVMMRGQSYKIVFVAQYGETYTITPATATVSMPESPDANSDNYDIFYFVEEVNNYTGQTTGAVTLNRAAALVNFYSNDVDWNNAASLGSTPAYSSVKLTGVPSSFNLLTDTAGETTTITYSRAEIPGNKHLAAAYCFDPDANIKAEVKLFTEDSDNSLVRTLEIADVPIATNMQTNITGAIMTGTIDFTISITTGTDSENKEI